MTKSISLIATNLMVAAFLTGCGLSTVQQPASDAQVKANIENDHNLTDIQKQALLDSRKSGQIRQQVRLSGKLPNGQPIPGYKPPKP
jgi:hypothetical protein